MTYELAKQLKDAGFTQQPNIQDIKWVDETRMVHQMPYLTMPEPSDLPYLPTLSELIEACGGNRKAFDLTHMMGRRHGWYASMSEVTLRGETPEEAVAKLWLGLNKDKQGDYSETKARS